VERARPVRVTWSAGVTARLEERDLDDPMLTQVWGDRVTRLVLTPGDVTALRVVVRQVDDLTDDRDRDDEGSTT